MSAPSTPPRPESGFARLKSFRSPTRAFTLTSPRPASPTTSPSTNGRQTPTRSATRDSASPSTTTKRSSIFPFQSRKSGLGSSTNPSSDAVHDADSSAPKVDEPASIADAPKPADAEVTQEPATETPQDELKPLENTTAHVRARSGSTVSSSSRGPLTPPTMSQIVEPIPIAKADADVTESPNDSPSLSRSPSRSRLRRQISNISRHSLTGSLRRVSLLGPASPPQVETAPVIGEMGTTLSRSSSVSSMRRLASPEPPVPQTEEPLAAEPISQGDGPQVEEPAEMPVTQEPAEAPAEIPAEAPAPAPVETPAPAPVEAPAPAPVETSTPEPELAPAPVEAAVEEAPKPAEPSTPPKPNMPSMSRNASTASLSKSPGTPGKDKPKPERRGTFGWARNSLSRKASGSGPAFVRSPSRGADSGAESETESIKERERGWNSGKAVPPVPTPKKSEDNIKRRFSLGRRSSEAGHAKTPSDSASETDKKSNWSKVFRAATKGKKDKEKDRADSSSLAASSTLAPSTVEAAPVPATIPEPRPSLSIPANISSIAIDQRPLSAIVESPIMPLNSQLLNGDAAPTSFAAVSSPLANSSSPVPESPVDIKPEDVNSEPELVAKPEPEPIVEAMAAPAAEPAVEAPVESAVEPAAASPEPVLNEVGDTSVESAVMVEPVVSEEAQPKDTVEAAGPSTAPASGAVTPAPVETEVAAVQPQSLMSPMSPNSPSSTPWDPKSQREIARARSPRRPSAVGGSSIRSRLPSPAGSIIGVKRKAADEPEVGKGRVRYLPDWAVSPAIQLAVTLSFVLPRRRRDAANPTNRRRGWWPMSRGTRTEMRYNAIRGVNEEVPIVSRSWTVPAVVRTTAKVVTAPARWMFHFFVPRSTTN